MWDKRAKNQDIRSQKSEVRNLRSEISIKVCENSWNSCRFSWQWTITNKQCVRFGWNQEPRLLYSIVTFVISKWGAGHRLGNLLCHTLQDFSHPFEMTPGILPSRTFALWPIVRAIHVASAPLNDRVLTIKNYFFRLNNGTEEQASPYITLLATSWILDTAMR